MRKLITTIIVFSLLSSMIGVQGHGGEEGSSVDVFYKAPKLNTSITIDGNETDWETIPQVELQLYSFVGVKLEDEVVAEIKVAYDDNNIYYLVEIADHFRLNLSNTALTPALGIATSINASTAAHMGSPSATELGTSTGTVDIMHWDIQSAPGEVVGGNSTSGEGLGNLDDEYATMPTNRFADNDENSYSGSYLHSNMTEGAEGHYTFEIKRPLITNDPNDVQFVENEQYEFNIAYWSPEETEDGWTSTGHFTYGARLFVGLGITPSEPVTEVNDTPLNSLLIFFALLFIPVLRKRKE